KLVETSNNIQAKFTSGGGVNLLKNSSGYGLDSSNFLLNWQVTSGSATQYIGDDCVDAGAGISIKDGIIKQAVSGKAGDFYTLTLRAKKSTSGTAYAKISDGQKFLEADLIATQ